MASTNTAGEKSSRIRDLPAAFWVANGMEIFERMAWYGFYAVSSLYITGSVESGGLGLTEEDRGIIQGIVTFFLYLFPFVTGALADRYGFRKTLLVSYILMTPAYYILGLPRTMWGFVGAFMFVAVGAAIFKPVIIATVARVTNKDTAPLGFGIFYMMVNVGGFIGPIAAGVVRGWGWSWVFVVSSGWIALNFLMLLGYKEPPAEDDSGKKKTFKEVMAGMVEVMGNGRFFVTIFGVLLMLVLGSKWLSWTVVAAMAGAWIALNLLWDLVARRGKGSSWLAQPMRVGDWRFVLFLLLMSGFYSAFNQLFITLPVYIRDFTDTGPLFELSRSIVTGLGIEASPDTLRRVLLNDTGTFKPEYLVNLNALCIVLFQIVVSSIFAKRRPFMTILVGLGFVTLSFALLTQGHMVGAVVAGICIFSFGEMMASPKAKEYVGRIAPPDKVGLYMGYFFWCMALGNLISGVLSGQLYGWALRNQTPHIMWGIFAGLAVFTGVCVVLYDRYVVPKRSAAEGE